jgi:hypothetical protein
VLAVRTQFVGVLAQALDAAAAADVAFQLRALT